MTNHKNALSAVDLYRMMYLIRRTEELLIEEYHPADEMRCPIHFCVGQEAAPAALGLALRDEDTIFSHYRSHGYYLAKGAPLDEMIAEFYGKSAGSNGGIAGSMELAHHDTHFYSGAIVGGSAGLAVGDAFAQKYLGTDALTVAVFGDGAMDEGVVYESMNLGALQQLPIIFLCENNHYAAHTALNNRTIAPDMSQRARAFGVAAEKYGDNDPVALRDTISRVVDTVRTERKPFFLEIETYRYCGHVGPESDDEIAYRPVEEVEARRAADPLNHLRHRLLDSGFKEQELNEFEADIEIRITASITTAKQADFPDPDWAQTLVTANTYDSVVTSFIEGPVGDFEGRQPDAKLAPY